MDVPAVHPSRGTAGTARGVGAVRSNEWLGHGDEYSLVGLRADPNVAIIEKMTDSIAIGLEHKVAVEGCEGSSISHVIAKDGSAQIGLSQVALPQFAFST